MRRVILTAMVITLIKLVMQSKELIQLKMSCFVICLGSRISRCCQ